MDQVICPFCKIKADLVSGKKIYPHLTELHYKPYYRCSKCGSYVGCHPGTTEALGTPADSKLRRLRAKTHETFDPIWKSGTLDRSQAYSLLTKELGIPAEECHIGMFDDNRCELAIEASKRIRSSHGMKV